MGRVTRRRPRRKLSIDEIIRRRRVYMLDRIFSIRYGRGLGDKNWQFPDDDAGLADLKILVHHYFMNPMAMPRIITNHAPWANADAIIAEVETHPQRYSKKRLGRLINLTGHEYRQYGIRTMMPVDMTDEQIRDYAKIVRAAQRTKRRRRAGIQPRFKYLGTSLSQTKPWLAEGISRAQWYRRKQTFSKHETSVAPVMLLEKDQTCLIKAGPDQPTTADRLAPSAKEGLEAVASPPLRSPTSLWAQPELSGDLAVRLYALGLLEAA
jgi:hypothetical protein